MNQVSQRTRDWIVVVGVNAVTAGSLFWQHARGEASAKATIIAAPIVFLLLNAVMLRSIRAKSHRLQLTLPKSLVIVAALLAIGGSASFWAALHNEWDDNELVNEVLSSKPIAAIRPERKAIVVQFYRTRLQNSRAYEAAAQGLKPIAPPLYSTASFANESVIQSALGQAKAAVSLDIDFAQKQETALDQFRSRMSKVDPEYLRSFEASRQTLEHEERGSIPQLNQWLDATTDLYSFVGANIKAVSVKDNQLVFADPKVKATFDAKKKRAVDLLQEVRGSEREGEERQDKALSEIPSAGLKGNRAILQGR
jgi:hypothetical protein